MRHVRALAAALVLLLLVAGIPALLAATVGNPLTGWPALVAGDLSDTVLVDVLAAVAYLAWAQFATAVIVESLSLLPRVQLPGRLLIVPTGQRRLARSLITAVFVLAPAATPLQLSGSSFPPPTPVIAAVPAAVIARPAASAHAPAKDAPASVPRNVAGTRAAAPGEVDGAQRQTYTIRADGPGTFWDLAEHFLGDGQRWQELWHLNDGRQQDDGTVMSSPRLLRPGWTVILPGAVAGPGAHLQPVAHTTADDASVPSEAEVTVQSGDSLWSIAESQLNDGRSWPTLFRLNRGRLQSDGGRLVDPDLIQPGWVLRLADVRAVGGTPPAAGPATATPNGARPSQPPLGPSPTIGATTTSPSATTPESTTPPSIGQRTIEGPATQTNAPDHADPTGTTTPLAESPERQSGSSSGVDLTGGWVAIPFAAAISAAGALVWLHRRRRYRYASLDPGHPDTDGLLDDDEDLQPLPAIVHRLRRAVRDQDPEWLDPPPLQPTVAEYVAAPDRYQPPPAGPSGLDLTGLTELAHPDGLGLTGPGADAAARALLVAVLSSGGPHDPDARGRLVIPSPTLQTLLGGDAGVAHDIPRLQATTRLAEALDLLEEEHLQRRRTLEEYDADDVADLRDADPTYPPMPQVLLLTHAPSEDLRARLNSLIRLGTAVDLRVVLLGDWPDGTTVNIDADGHTTIGNRSHRVATLGTQDAIDVLHVLREAHTGQPIDPPPAVRSPERSPNDPPAPSEVAAAEPDLTSTTDDALLPDREDAETHTASDQSSSPDEIEPGDAADACQPVQPVGPAVGQGRVAIRVFGRLAVLDPNGQPVPGLRQHAGGLLVYLVIHRAGADKDDIMEALWSEASLRRASERLSTEVGNLRRCIRQSIGNDNIQPVVNTGGRYHLDPALMDVDAWAFYDSLRQATTASDPAERFVALQAAVNAHTGPLAEGRQYHWLEPVREQLRRNGIRARLHLADLVSAAQPGRAADLTKEAADLDPANEELARLAMGAHARIGDIAAVTARLRHLRAALREIDEEPSPETLTLAAQLQRSKPEARPLTARVPANGRARPSVAE